MSDVAGYCPMGCGQTLVLGEGGHVTCSWARCPRPAAVDELLSDRETEHIVRLDAYTFAVEHPLRERLDGELFDCALHAAIATAEEPPEAPGRYRVRAFDQPWERLPSAAAPGWPEVCPAQGCAWDSRGTNNGAGPSLCGNTGLAPQNCLIRWDEGEDPDR